MSVLVLESNDNDNHSHLQYLSYCLPNLAPRLIQD